MTDLSNQNLAFVDQLHIQVKKHLETANLLFINDDRIANEPISNALGSMCRVVSMLSVNEIVSYCQYNHPDIVVLPLNQTSLVNCRRLKSQSSTRHIPVLFIADEHTTLSEDSCWEAGGDEYVAYPVNPKTLVRRVKHQLESKFNNIVLKDLAQRDGLTGVYSRRYFNEKLPQLLRDAHAMRSQCALVMIDVDNFKSYNEQYGYLAGDRCLIEVAKAISACLVRQDEMIARFSAEEFVVVLPHSNKSLAFAMCQRILNQIQELSFGSHMPIKTEISVSLGMAVYGVFDEYPVADDLINLAETNVLQAQRLGKNRVVL